MSRLSLHFSAPGMAALTLAMVQFTVATGRAQLLPGPDPITGTNNNAQTLAGGTGTVSASGNLSVGGGSVAVTITGSSTLNNLGTIQQTGSGRAIRLTANGVASTVNNGSAVNSTALVQAVGDDAFQVNQTGTSVTLNNYGTLNSLGGQAVDWNAITTGANTLNNFSTGVLSATGNDTVRPGVNSVIINSGTIRATPVQSGGNASGSDGIDAQTNTGVQVTNNGLIEGRAGITGGVTVPGTFAISVTNNPGGTISGVNGSGINIDGVATTVTATIINQAGATIKGNWDGVSANGDGDGIDVDGVIDLTNRGFIRGLGANGVGSDGFVNGPDGVAAGGGTIVNEAGAEITAAVTSGNATSSQAILIDNSSRGNSIAATAVTNRGFISSTNGAAIILISDATTANSVTNDTGGTIRGTGAAASGAVIQTGNGNDSVINRGAITATGANGVAIDLQGGNNTLQIEGGAASITGDVNGGTGGANALIFSPGSGNTFSYAGRFSNFASTRVNAGTVILPGNGNTYAGTTTINAGGTLQIDGDLALTGSSVLSIGIGGPAANGPQSAGFLRVNGSATLAGQLVVDLAPGAAAIGDNDAIVLLIANAPLAGGFANVANNGQIMTADGTTTFFVNYGPGSRFDPSRVVLTKSSGGPPARPAFFNGEIPLSNGVYFLRFAQTGNFFGYYAYLSDPRFIFHFDLGYEYWFDNNANDGRAGIFFYDFKSGSFFYTSPVFPFPYLYDFSLQAVLYYFPDPNNPERYNTNGTRFFYNYATGQIITK